MDDRVACLGNMHGRLPSSKSASCLGTFSPALSGLLADLVHFFPPAVARADGHVVTDDVIYTALSLSDGCCLISATADGLHRVLDADA